MDVVYLDFQEAFDKVPHRRLLLWNTGLGVSMMELVLMLCT